MRPAILAVILLGAAGAVTVLDDIRGAAFSAFVGLFDHRIDQAGEPDATQFKQKDSLLVEPLPSVEVLTVLEHAVDRVEKLPHDRDYGNHLGLSSSQELFVEGPDAWFVADC